MWPLLALRELVIVAHPRLMSAAQSSGAMASLALLSSETQASARPPTKLKVSGLTVSTLGGALSPHL